MTVAKASLQRPTKVVERAKRAKAIHFFLVTTESEFTCSHDNDLIPDMILFTLLSADSKLFRNMFRFHHFRVNGRGKWNEMFADTKWI